MPSSRSSKILYIESDSANRHSIYQGLEKNGYQVLLASDGLSGLRLAQAEHPSLILIDLEVSGLDGYEVATRARGLPSLEQTPIVALADGNQAGVRERALIAGCTGYIQKPVAVDVLTGQIEAYLAGLRDQLTVTQQHRSLRAYNSELVKKLESMVIELDATNRELKEAHNTLQKLDKMKSDFIALAAHELRTPISLVHGYAHLMMTKADDDDTLSSEEMLQSLLDASNHLNKTVNDLINVANVEMGKIELFLTPLSIDYPVHSALNELAPLSQGRNLSIEIMELNNLPFIEGDAQHLQQVFWNLLSNAIKYTPDGGQIQLWGRESAEGVEVIVEDTGIGIDPQDQRHIFGRFNVLENILHHSTSDTSFLGGGLGLGLYIVQGIVEAHRGKVWVESEGFDEEHCPGSKFHVLLPKLEV